MIRIMLILTLIFPITSLARPSYDRENNVVTLTTNFLEKTDRGYIKIYNDKHIEITGFGGKNGKTIFMCSKELSLGLLFLDDQLQIGTDVPEVTDVVNFTSSSKSEAGTIEAGWVKSFVLRDDDALDLLDLLYEYDKVGFAILSTKCTPVNGISTGKIIINFDTRGIERAMKRLK